MTEHTPGAARGTRKIAIRRWTGTDQSPGGTGWPVGSSNAFELLLA
jgi:hypothetical protein